jgi:hypothetical protein
VDDKVASAMTIGSIATSLWGSMINGQTPNIVGFGSRYAENCLVRISIIIDAYNILFLSDGDLPRREGQSPLLWQPEFSK